ncbi:MAG: tetratricopeptide repeat protein [Planctomycetes bacterium]|nr:tetratricopeptide repeat protein [Planctomycetota bacterium]
MNGDANERRHSRFGLGFVGGLVLGALAMFFAREWIASGMREVVARETQVDGAAKPDASHGPDLAVPVRAATNDAGAEIDERVQVKGAPSGVSAATAANDRLLELIARGRNEGWLQDQALAEMLFWNLASQGHLEEAWELALAYTPDQQHLFLNLASQAHNVGAFALRDKALERALALGWVDPSFLAQIDPALALTRFDQLVAAADPSERGALRLGYAQLLASLGRNDEALAITNQRLATNPNDEAALELLSSLDVAAAEAHLRLLIDTHDPQNDWTRKLIDLLDRQGRPAEAAEWLAGLQATGRPVYSGDWGEIADAYVAAEDSEGAVDAWLEALRLEDGDPDAWTGPLLAAAPQKLLAALEARVATGEHDEFWGALADARWIGGQKSAAIDAWKHAAALDPGDGEWPNKLALAEAGKDPFGG